MAHPNEFRTKTAIARRFLEDLQLHGFAVRTQESYVRAIRQLAYHYHKSPDKITDSCRASTQNYATACILLNSQHLLGPLRRTNSYVVRRHGAITHLRFGLSFHNL
jgi:hypothetical protein